MSKFQSAENRKELREYHQKGEGLYLYKNNTKGTLSLPKPTAGGIKEVPINGEWQGDNYYMSLVKTHDARLVKELLSPEQEKKSNMEKLILDQPDFVTNQGKVEHVVVDPFLNELTNSNQEKDKKKKYNKKYNESKPSDDDLLLNEMPVTGIEIING